MSPRMYIANGELPKKPCAHDCEKRASKIQQWITGSTSALGLDNLRTICQNTFDNQPAILRRLLGLCDKREGELQAKAGGVQYWDVAKGEEDPNDLDYRPGYMQQRGAA